ncbi:4-(cytidine 5'-diphospho)-2-C-methyl-D-erythritol kinase [Lentibacillus sp. JNUCC-1]|uniref:4-(cytidine 5'-diphospho)-2-C-methyl-D-erythritol kinase n=1 Tax=Lentibacillus sp. JNUCC-1 TaxID=2654513 RepID=UPI0012E8632C|nr:4-(cytidine 5'-diphospho)-2-C-methyl-D-erythritol kinase [Lentibacillus sp. JNUCC-1]MUV38018.1 4-(cytidine 5'-diphospho)-2-C-methyl-D-erythritol kinase [Lentibacillus sp. JNUCC-1]
MVLFEKAPAKINLSLDILNKRSDGYHNVEMVMTTIDLADRISLYPVQDTGITVMADNQYVPNDERNLAYKAAELFKKTYRISQGIHIHIEKNIPVSAGLGGGSSDAAAVLRGLRRLWNLETVTTNDLADLGAEIGSDVPFCVYGHTALATGKGETITSLPAPPPCWVVLARPDIGVSTRNVFPQLNVAQLPPPYTAGVMDALKANNLDALCAHIGNHLESVTLKMYPQVQHIKSKMQQYNMPGVLMSGSGPTLYGLTPYYSKARRAYNGLSGFCHDVKLVRIMG